jgi:putative ABC transport system substrate-binding protein
MRQNWRANDMKSDPRKTEIFELTRFLLNRKLIWLFCCFLFLIPIVVSAEKEPKILVINSDMGLEKYRTHQEAFKEAIARPVLEINLGDKKWENISNVEEMLYDEDPDIIYCVGTKAYMIANKYAFKKSIVFSSTINWLRLPTTERTYGVSNELYAGMEITLFRSIFPKVQKIGVLYSKKYTEEWFKNTVSEAKEMGVELIGQATQKKQAVLALKNLLSKVDAFWLIPDPEIMSDKDDLLNLLKECDTQKKLVFSYHEAFVEFGAALIVSADDPTIGRQVASIVKDILSGNKPDEKVQFPAGTYTILDMKKVYEYGVEYSEDAISWINEVRNYSITKGGKTYEN